MSLHPSSLRACFMQLFFGKFRLPSCLFHERTQFVLSPLSSIRREAERGPGQCPGQGLGDEIPNVPTSYAVKPHSMRTAYSGCSSFTPKPSIFQPTVLICSSGSAVPALPAGLTITRGLAPLKLV